VTQSSPGELFSCQKELVSLLDTLSDVIFCAKDLDHRYVEVNAAFVRRTSRRSKRNVIGSMASDVFPVELAERYDAQDRQVIDEGRQFRDELELILGTDGDTGWYLTTKLPVREPDGTGEVVGLVSVSRDLRAPSDRNIALADLQNVVGLVADRLGERISVAEMAQAAGCSRSQLDSRMKRVFDLSATQYVLRVRVNRAAELLASTDRSVADIGTQCGFYDQPQFTRQFARLTNYTPAQFRDARTAK